MLSASYRYFHALALECSIRKAADRAHISPSAMSRQIAILEQELGETLLERRARGVVLTGAGRLLLDHIGRLMQLEQELRTDLSELSGLRSGHVRIAVGNGFAASVASFMPQFAADHPQIRLSIVVAASDEILRNVEEEEVELGFMFDAPSHQAVELVSSFPAPLIAVVPVGHHPSRNRKAVPLSVLEGERMALLCPSHSIRQVLQRVELQEGLKLAPMVESNSYEVLKTFVTTACGSTILPRISVVEDLKRKRLGVVEIDNPTLRSMTASVVKRRGRKLSAAATEFLKVLQQLGPQFT